MPHSVTHIGDNEIVLMRGFHSLEKAQLVTFSDRSGIGTSIGFFLDSIVSQ